MATIKDNFTLAAIDYFINTDMPYFQLVLITELATSDLELYIKSLNDKNMKEHEIKLITA